MGNSNTKKNLFRVFLEKYYFEKMSFVIKTDTIGPMINQLVNDITGSVAQELQGCRRNTGFCQTTGDGKWKETIDLTSMPTKQEDIHVKMEQESNTISVSGKAETNKTTPAGVNVFSTHVWSKQIKLPKEVDSKTLSAKMISDVLVLTAEFKSQEINIEIPNLD